MNTLDIFTVIEDQVNKFKNLSLIKMFEAEKVWICKMPKYILCIRLVRDNPFNHLVGLKDI